MKGIIKCKCPHCGKTYTLNLPQEMWDYFVEKCAYCGFEATITQFLYKGEKRILF